jgi:hypothetical protein
MLWPHLDVSGAVISRDEAVRRLLIDRVRYHYLQGDLAAGLERAESIVESWTELLKEITDPEGTALRVSSCTFVSTWQTCRVTRRFEEARRVDQVSSPSSPSWSPDHPHARDPRRPGRRPARAGHYQALESDPDPCAVARPVRRDHRVRSLRQQRRHLPPADGRLRWLGEGRARLGPRKAILGDTNLFTLASATSVARDVRDAGDVKSADMLRHVYQDWVDTRGPHRRPDDTVELPSCPQRRRD